MFFRANRKNDGPADLRARAFVALAGVSLIVLGLCCDASATPGVVRPPAHRPPALLRAIDASGDIGQNSQDERGRTIRASREPWHGLDQPTRGFVVRRYTPSGALDRGFANRGRTRPDAFGRPGEDWFVDDPLPRTDGGVIVVGVMPAGDAYNKSAGFELRSFTTRGAADRRFSDDGVYRRTVKNTSSRPQFDLRDAALDSQGNIWVCGQTIDDDGLASATAYAISADGSGVLPGSTIDFALSKSDVTACGSLADDGRGGIFAAAADEHRIELKHRSSHGLPDMEFGLLGTATVDPTAITGGTGQEIYVLDVKVDPAGRIWVSALLALEQTPQRTRIWRLDPRGLLDNSFAGTGSISIAFIVGEFWFQGDDGLLAGGFRDRSDDVIGGIPMLARIGDNGSKDPQWAGGHALRASRLKGRFGQMLTIGARHFFGPVVPLRGKRPSALYRQITLR